MKKALFFLLCLLLILSGCRYKLKTAQKPQSYSGTLTGMVKDAVVGSPIQGAQVSIFRSQELLGSTVTEDDGSYSLEILPGSDYRVEFSKEGYITAIYYNTIVTAGSIIYLEAVLQIQEEYAGPGTVSGIITNALDGLGISGLAIELREGINVEIGPVVTSTITGPGGYYNIDSLEAGNYTAEVSGDGYITAYFTIVCIGGQETRNQNFSITPVMGEGETRIVLTWGEYPLDLDSHLTGPKAPGDNSLPANYEEEGRFHIFYANKTYTYDKVHYADLDMDIVTGYGPETLTIHRQAPGIYRYSVHDYSNRHEDSNYGLANSGAQVKVYHENTPAATFNVPFAEGTLWTVFTLENGTITPVNIMSYRSSPLIQSLTGNDLPDAALLFMNLPEKK